MKFKFQVDVQRLVSVKMSACKSITCKGGFREIVNRWTPSQELTSKSLATEPDDRVKLWALARLTNQRQTELARVYGYRDGSGVAYAIRQVEAEAARNDQMADKLARMKDEIYRLQKVSNG
jgi:hypothetical protein